MAGPAAGVHHRVKVHCSAMARTAKRALSVGPCQERLA